MDILNHYRAVATFFVVGANVAARPDLIELLHRSGHALGNHTWSHSDLRALTDDGIRDEIGQVENVLETLGIERPLVVRPPYGYTNSRVRRVIQGMGLSEELWTIDPRDWEGICAAHIAEYVLQRLAPGSVILLHDGATGARGTPAALELILAGALSRGYCFGLLEISQTSLLPAPTATLFHGDE